MKLFYSIKGAWHSLMVLGAFLPLVLLLIWVGLVVHSLLLEKSLQQEKVVQDLIHSSVEQEVSRLKTMLENKSDPIAYGLIRDQDKELFLSLFNNVLQREPSIHLLVLLDDKGKAIFGQGNYSASASIDHSPDQHLMEMSPGSEAIIIPLQGGVFVGSSGLHDEGVFITISVPVAGDGAQFVLLAEIDANLLLNNARRYMKDEGINSYIVDKSGLLLAVSNSSLLNVGDDVSYLLPVAAMLKEQSWLAETQYQGIKGAQVFGSYSPIEDFGWKIVTEIDSEIITQPIFNLMINLALLSGMVVLLFLILGMFLVKQVIKPIELISSDFQRAGKQDFMPSKIRSSFIELDNMVIGFNNMVEEMSRKQRHINKASIVYENTSEGIVITDARPNILSVNNAFTVVTGYSEDEVIGKNPSFLSSGLHDDGFFEGMWGALKNTGHWQGEIQNRRKNGEIYTELLSINSFKDEKGEVIEYIGVFADISKIKEAENKLDYLAHHDPLTNLPNRLLCNARIKHELEYAKRHDHMVAIMLLDLDMFKNINDSLGHVVGDKLLKKVTERLSTRIRDEDTISRIGGDEFVLVVGSIKSKEDVSLFADNILDLFSLSFDVGEHEIFIGASIGISLFPEDGTDGDSLLKNADAAMYRAKEEGRDNYRFYTQSLTNIASQRLNTETYLRYALEKDELVLYYQPQYSLLTGKMIAVEALIRWQHPVDGLVFPDAFISVAEQSGLIVSIGEWVIETACRQLKQWEKAGCSQLRMAINLSARQFRKPGLADTVKRIFCDTGVLPSKIDLELTESIIMQDAKSTIDTLNKFHEMGVELSIDDFGTGYSSLSYLKKFPINRLKIDRTFVNEITTDDSDADLINSIIAMGHCMNLKVLAEGVETIEQINYLKQHGCDEVQGYYYSKPIPADELEALCKKDYL